MGTLKITASRSQGEDVEERGTHVGGELGDRRTRDAAIGAQEQHGLLVSVEPGLELTGPVADDGHVGIVITIPVQLGQWPDGDELGAQRLPIRK